MKKTLFAAVLTLLAATLSAPAADFGHSFDKRFQFELGGAWDSFDTQASLEYTRGNVISGGATIDFEKLLNIPVMKEHFRGSADWRFTRVSHVQVSFESIAREGERVLDDSITWGDTTFSANALINGKFNTDEIYLGYRWDAWKADNVVLAPTIGFSYYDIDAALTGQGKVTQSDGTERTGSFEKGFSIKAPVPVVGLVAEGAISGKVSFGFYIRALFISLTDISGGTLQSGLKLKWYFLDNVGVGGGVDVTSIQLRKWVEDNQTFKAKYTFAGPSLFLAAAF